MNLLPFLPILYAIATFVMTLYGANLLWLAVMFVRNDRLKDGPVPPADAPPPVDRDGPAVTVQLPLYNEPVVCERLIDACAALDYPRSLLEIQVLDDSTDETTAIVARRVAHWQERGVDITLVHRADRGGYKAGALKNGLRLARGAFIAIFDADFIPAPDFLRRMLPHFDRPDVGMVQARWGHLNAGESLLTRIQAFGLDAHFALEQFVRNRAGYFMNFNGTAGIWRRACIEDGGDWESDTLAEDLDLSYRAQLKGWRFTFVGDIEVPAELPRDLDALRSQQFRWTKGATEAGRKLLGRLWRSGESRGVKVEGTFQLTAHFVFPCILAAALLHAPLLLLNHLGYDGPGPLYFAFLGFGLIGFFGFFLAQLFAQRALYPDWLRRVAFFPLFMAGSIGLALNNTRALALGLAGKRTPFVRTPKGGTTTHRLRISPWSLFEALLAAYSLAGLVAVTAYGEWAAVPFQAMFALGFGLVTAYNFRDLRRQRAPLGTTPRG
ncbi:MAG: glycosyltransferase family 2 protein [Rhodothermales bacterium]